MTLEIICGLAVLGSFIIGFFIGKDSANKAHFEEKVEEIKQHVNEKVAGLSSRTSDSLNTLTKKVQGVADTISDNLTK